jgi:hypothetical protein
MGFDSKARQLLICFCLLPTAAFGALTVTDRGTGGSNASSSTETVTPASNMAAGSMGVLCYGGDNANGTSTNIPATITDSVGNVWTRRPDAVASGANLATESAIYTAQLTTAFTTSNNLVINFTVATVAKAWTLMEVAPAAGSVVMVVNDKTATFLAQTTRTLTLPVQTNAVMIGTNSIESADTFVGDADTLNGNWSTKQSIGQGTGAAGAAIISQWKVVNAAGVQTYDPTFTSADGAAAVLAAIETNSSARAASALNTAESTSTIPIKNAIAQGSMAVLAIAADNQGSLGSTAVLPTSITDSKSNTWTQRKTIINDPGAAGAGVEVGLYTCVLGTALDLTDSLSVPYQAAVSVTSKAWAIWEFPTYTTFDVGSGNTNTGLGTAVTTGATSITNAHLIIAMMGAEGPDTVTAFDTDTTNGSWSKPAWASTGSNATTDMSMATQYKIVNATGNQTWDATITSTDWATATISISAVSATATSLHFFDFFP